MKYEEMTLAMLKAIIERRVILVEETHDVKLRTIAFVDPSDDVEYVDDSGHLVQNILCRMEVDGENVDYIIVWDTVEYRVVGSKNMSNGNQWSMERFTLMQFADGKTNEKDVADTFGLELTAKVKHILKDYKRIWKSIDAKGKSEEELEEIKTKVTYDNAHSLLLDLRKSLSN